MTKQYKKPKRPCPYCSELFCNLPRHLKRQHPDEAIVKQAILHPDKKETIFAKLRKQGILNYNKKQTNANAPLMRERRQGNEELIVCSVCKGFYSKRKIYSHKKKCDTENAECSKGIPFVLPVDDLIISDEFRNKIILSFRSDAVGKICQTDKAVLLLGDWLWAKSARKEKRVIMSNMRALGNLIKRMQDLTNTNVTGEDLLKRGNFEYLKKCIVEMTTYEQGEMKPGLRLSIGYVLKKLIKIMKGHYVMKDCMKAAEEVDLFNSALQMNWDYIFFTAQISYEVRRNSLRKPADMPLEKDVKTLRNFVLKEIKSMTEDPYTVWDKHTFIRLRNLIVTRLTLFNARRGGEPARMTLQDWSYAEAGTWIDPQLVEKVDDPLEKSLLNKFKLAYQSGKGSRRLVPILIPNDTVDGIRKLVKERDEIGILSDNLYLFPNTGSSTDHSSGWNSIRDVLKLVDGLENPKLLIADKYRHRASTLYAMSEIPQDQRAAFYKHMGHTENVNKEVYQCPLAIKEVTQVGRFFEALDENCETVDCSIPNTRSEAEQETSSGDIQETEETHEIVNSTSITFTDTGKESNTRNVANPEGKKGSNAARRYVNANPEGKKGSNTARRYVKWDDKDYGIVKNYFKQFIEDISASGVKGSLPSKAQLLHFLTEHIVLKDLSEKDKISVIKVKIFNERAKFRRYFAHTFKEI